MVVQADETGLPTEVLLWGERKSHKGSNRGHTHCQPASDGHATGAYAAVEFFRTGHDGQDQPDVLRAFL